MGRFILCASRVAKKPYVFPVSDTRLYSIEELCFYIYNNIYEVSADSFDETLVNWLREEIGLNVIADKLQNLISIHGSLRDIVVTILCGCDYYSEAEIKALVVVMSEIESLSRNGRKKKQADAYLKYGKYVPAKRCYDTILSGGQMVGLSDTEKGDLLHNRSIACFYMGEYREACMGFKKAFEYNKNEESRRHHLLALLINNDQGTFDIEVANYGLSDEDAQALVAEMSEAYMQANESEKFKEAEKYRLYAGKEEAEKYAAGMIEEWKKQIRYGYS